MRGSTSIDAGWRPKPGWAAGFAGRAVCTVSVDPRANPVRASTRRNESLLRDFVLAGLGPQAKSAQIRRLPPLTLPLRGSLPLPARGEREGVRGFRSREARGVDGLFGDELEQCRSTLAGLLDAVADRRHDLLGLGDALAIATERPGEIGII